MAKVLALIMIIALGGGGAAAGFVLRPPPEPADPEAAVPEIAEDLDSVATLRDGFIVPVLRDGRVWSHVVLRLGVSSDRSASDQIAQKEPVLRDGLNEALFLHGNLGGFDGDFTDPVSMARLRTRLDAVLQDRLSDPTAKVLIVSMARQSG
ncbi:hypothetical protein [Jannaschia donghaensis]|uniref:Flagellar basal body-associated protein FliL n=1 Tax=Jannaschia donghaensis TaxID=420998 RepID=A0A0M6YJ57_9RHOB|nr:hypothetical protein [Jannaschia donghaensis]CTQ49096.1 hypothetical protein JDO7802_01106 [Jannaschia donghaensis]